MHRSTFYLKMTGLVAFVCLFLMIDIGDSTVAEARGFRIRPPYDGTYILTAFCDHNLPNYNKDGEITICTGEAVADCSPHCYEGHPGYDWAMYEGTPILAVCCLLSAVR